ncbi:MAG: hypothetical protein CMG21_00005, partial [Candidatus Marinimicrobia bacterium]|nr:hypothetical protein [Candidatus Neomarinimicrobiota bacterium]
MKKFYLFLFISLLLPSSTWQAINSSIAKSMNLELISSDIDNTVIKFSMDGFHLVKASNSKGFIVKTENGASLLEKGLPDLQKITKSIIIPDNANMAVNITSYKYEDFENIHILPSKGNLTRDINPDEVPFAYDQAYKKNEFYPNQISELGSPYIVRDLRGQAVSFNPFQYNPVTKTLRAYTEITVEVVSKGTSSINAINRIDEPLKLASEYNEIYSSHFINYDNDTRFTYLLDQGNMLVISNSAFLSTMQPFVDWKNKRGIPTEMVSTIETGSSAAQIESYISDYYYENGLTFVLLVGDYAQVTSPSVGGSASDPSYGFIVGNDKYAEVMIGRFSGSTPNHIATQVERSIAYEKRTDGDYFNNAAGFASNQGPGFGGMSDDDFNDFLWEDVLSEFTYDNYYYEYDGQGGSDQGGINTINNGVGIINYTGHGSISSWGNGSSLSTSQINSLTNTDKLPFVITVGCNVGEFNSTNECFAESWQRATHNGQPAGGIAHLGSTISQSWEPPMHGQYGMNLIITESYGNLEGNPPFGHKTRTIGGISTNGCLHMNDAQGSSGQNETQYWTLFGDPSLMFRTDVPQEMNISHDDIILIGQENFSISTGIGGSLAAISIDGVLLSSGYANSTGVIDLNLSGLVDNPGVFDLVITGFNAITYETEITVLTPEGPYLTMDGHTSEVMYGNSSSISFDVENIGTDPADELTVTLSTEDEYVFVTDNVVITTLEAGAATTISGFAADVSANIPNGHDIVFDVSLVSGEYSWNYSFNTTAMAPEVNLLSISGDLQPGSTSSVVISMINEGGTEIMYPEVNLVVGQYLTISNLVFTGSDYAWSNEDGEGMAGNMQQLIADITVSSSAPMGSMAELMVMIDQLNSEYHDEFMIEVPIGQVTADFESDSSLEWDGAFNPWAVSDQDAHTGLYSFQSAQIADNQNSSTGITLDVTQDGNIEFWYRVSAEYSMSGNYFYDGLEFYVNGQLQGQYQTESDGTSPWKFVSFPVSVGETTFTWTYVKDSGGGSTDCTNTDCADAAFIDDIVFPPVYMESDVLLGDTNGDSILNVLDVIAIVNMVLGSSDPDLSTA